MKKLLMSVIVLLGLVKLNNSNAQISVNVNIGKPVAPEPWYGVDDNYYYMPDQGVYYNVNRRVYVYPENGRWVYASSLPGSYGRVNYRQVRHVRIHGKSPFDRDGDYKKQYGHDNGKHKGWDKHRDHNDHRDHDDHDRH